MRDLSASYVPYFVEQLFIADLGSCSLECLAVGVVEKLAEVCRASAEGRVPIVLCEPWIMEIIVRQWIQRRIRTEIDATQ